MVRRDLAWMLTQDLAGIIVVAGLVWLGREFLQTLGGGIALFLVGAHAGLLRKQVRSGHDRLLLFVAQYAYILLMLNIISGLAGRAGSYSWAWDLSLSVLVLASTVVLLAAGLVFLPPATTSAPSWRDSLWKQLTIVVLVALFFRFLSPLIPVASIADPYVLPAVAAFACSAFVAALMVYRVPRGETGSGISTAMNKFVIGSPVWIVLGSIAEILRGSWVVWTASAAAVFCTLLWIWALAGRSPLSGLAGPEQRGRLLPDSRSNPNAL